MKADGLAVTCDATGRPNPLMVGRKGAGLLRMTSLGLPVPPFFVLTTGLWRRWRKRGRLSSDELSTITGLIGWLERHPARGDGPLSLAVRSAGPESMPGMLSTVLGAGPAQVLSAVEEVLRSWNSPRARLYRSINGLGENLGVAVVVQVMVRCDADRDSGAGVLFTRDPVTGVAAPCGEWLTQAYGDDLVSGRATPGDLDVLRGEQPAVHDELLRTARLLERESRYPQDIEFAVERGRLYLLQTRGLRAAPLAAYRIALDLLDEGLIGPDDVVERLRPVPRSGLATVVAKPGEPGSVAATGAGAAPGVAHGVLVRDIPPGHAPGLVLLRPETSPADLAAIARAAALVTERGGMTSHAAIIARELSIPCVVGCGALALADGAEVTVDGTRGVVHLGHRPTHEVVPEVVARADEVIAAALLLRVAVHGVVPLDEAALPSSAAADLVVDGMLDLDDGFLTLSPAGDLRLTNRLQASTTADPAALTAFADAFEPLDAQVKGVLSAWQRAQRTGDEQDRLAAVERWLAVDARLRDVAGPVAELEPFRENLAGLAAARDRVLAGEVTELTGIAPSSYHSRWSALHETVLRLAARERQS